jgi:hypothetical protein
MFFIVLLNLTQRNLGLPTLSSVFLSDSMFTPSAVDRVETNCNVFCKLNIISSSTEGTTRVIFIVSRLSYWLIQ